MAKHTTTTGNGTTTPVNRLPDPATGQPLPSAHDTPPAPLPPLAPRDAKAGWTVADRQAAFRQGTPLPVKVTIGGTPTKGGYALAPLTIPDGEGSRTSRLIGMLKDHKDTVAVTGPPEVEGAVKVTDKVDHKGSVLAQWLALEMGRIVDAGPQRTNS